MVVINQNVTIKVQLIFVCVQKRHKQASDVPQTRIMVEVSNSAVMTVAVILRSRLFKMIAERKKVIYLCY